MNFYTSARNNPTDQIFVFFSEEKSVGVKTMRKLVIVITRALCHAHTPFVRLLGILEEKSIQRGIIVFPGNMTPSARKVRHLRSPDFL
jgi:DNA-directed RNA polymerase I, II, and III subunit RPABC1